MDDYLASCITNESEGRQLSVSTQAAKGIDRRDSARSVRPTSDASTATRMDASGLEAGIVERWAVQSRPKRGEGVVALEAGTQALPVDTIPKRLGRPRKHPDRKAYRAEWLRKDRRDHPEKYGKPAKGQ